MCDCMRVLRLRVFALSDGGTNGNKNGERNLEQYAYLKTASTNTLGLHDDKRPFNPAFEVVCEIDLT